MVWTGGWTALEMMAGLSSGQFLRGFHITPRLLLDRLSLGLHCLPVYRRHASRLALLLGARLRAGLARPRRHRRRHQRRYSSADETEETAEETAEEAKNSAWF